MPTGDLALFFLQISVMLFTALLCGQLARKLRFPAVLGELLGGIVIGPTVWGWLSPGSFDWLFPATGPVFQGREALVQLCILFFLFAVGLEMNTGLIIKRRAAIAWTSLPGIAVPFVSGMVVVLAFPGFWGEPAQGRLWLFALFMGTALSISALPVIARILMDINLLKTEMGAIVMGSATLNDLIGWSLFAAVLGSVAPENLLNLPPYATFVIVLGLFAVMLTVGRAAARRAQDWLRSNLPWPGGFLGVAAAIMLAVAAVSEAIGIHAVFGAFLAGLAFSEGQEKRNEAHEMVYQFVMYFFAPLYFVSVGLRANFVTAFDPVLVAVVLIVACAGKIIGATLGAMAGRVERKQALAIGFAMNARGAMEMLLATVALDVGLIDDRIYVALITMALVTSVISGPAIERLIHPVPAPVQQEAVEPYRGLALYEDFREED